MACWSAEAAGVDDGCDDAETGGCCCCGQLELALTAEASDKGRAVALFVGEVGLLCDVAIVNNNNDDDEWMIIKLMEVSVISCVLESTDHEVRVVVEHAGNLNNNHTRRLPLKMLAQKGKRGREWVDNQ